MNTSTALDTNTKQNNKIETYYCMNVAQCSTMIATIKNNNNIFRNPTKYAPYILLTACVILSELNVKATATIIII